ncbi:MAG: TetR/AcrR family transcriptional regulator, partial [Thermomicrobiales bacterium]
AIPPLRADAQRNRDRILTAACEVFVEAGPDAPLEDVIARAGVGFGTLYRRFPDRAALNRAVVIYVLERLHAIAETAVESSGPDSSLARYMHDALDLRIGAVVPMLIDRVAMDDEEIDRLRRRDAALVEELIARAHADGALRDDVGFGDIGLLLIRFSRPLPGPITPEMDNALAHRHLDILLEGLRSRPPDSLSGPSLELDDLLKLASDDKG